MRMMHQRWLFAGCMIIAFFVFGMIFMPVKTEAATPKEKGLNPGTVYTQYDVTEDGKADKLKIAIGGKDKDGAYHKMKIWVNDKCVFSDNHIFYTVNANYISLRNRREFLYIRTIYEDEISLCCAILHYDSSTNIMKRAVNPEKMIPSNTFSPGYSSMAGVRDNTIVLRMSVMSRALASLPFYCNYTWNGKTVALEDQTMFVTPTGDTGAISCKKYYTVSGPVKAYTTATSSTKAFTLKKGDRIKIPAVNITGNTMRFKVYINGKKGWVSTNAYRLDSKGYKRPIVEGQEYAG